MDDDSLNGFVSTLSNHAKDLLIEPEGHRKSSDKVSDKTNVRFAPDLPSYTSLSTPGVHMAKVEGTARASSLRSRRFGAPRLGPPKRTIRQQLEEAAEMHKRQDQSMDPGQHRDLNSGQNRGQDRDQDQIENHDQHQHQHPRDRYGPDLSAYLSSSSINNDQATYSYREASSHYQQSHGETHSYPYSYGESHVPGDINSINDRNSQDSSKVLRNHLEDTVQASDYNNQNYARNHQGSDQTQGSTSAFSHHSPSNAWRSSSQNANRSYESRSFSIHSDTEVPVPAPAPAQGPVPTSAPRQPLAETWPNAEVQVPEIKPKSKGAEAPKKNKSALMVNGKSYTRLELIGKGGSSKVYRVQSEAGRIYAVKKVVFEDTSPLVVDGFKGEIDLLLRLRDESRVVRLVDYEMTDLNVLVVMECGEIDLAHVLAVRLNQPLDMSFVRYYSAEMFKCVEAVHRHDIVHSDLKPANFLLVKGMLKIIDFGIANVVPDYTSNVHRDAQIGTPNYMAPEALLDANHARPGSTAKFKVGKHSDVWSCGCIMYQMLYGRPPYGNYNGPQRMMAIMNPKVQVHYPRQGLGEVRIPKDALDTIKQCLTRDPASRMTVAQALDGPFLNPQSVTRLFIKNLLEHAVQYGADRGEPLKEAEVLKLSDDLWKKIQSMNM